jgi:prepilin-type N-terminal cleavage/methylation domain-containing protein
MMVSAQFLFIFIRKPAIVATTDTAIAPRNCAFRGSCTEDIMKTNRVNKNGFTLVEIMIVVAIIGLLAAIAVPNFVRARNTAQKNACIQNLRQIDGAKQQWAIELRRPDTAEPTEDEVANYIKNNQYPHCPASGTYTINPVNTGPTCDLGPTLSHELPNP